MQPRGSIQFDAEQRRWTLQRGLLEAVVLGGSENVLALSYGGARLKQLCIYEALLGGALFSAQEMIARGNSVRLTAFAPSSDPTATPTDLDDPKQSLFRLCEVGETLELHYRSLCGLPMGCVLFALDFEPGGVWESEEGSIKPVPGQAFHLKEGRGRMRYGRDCIELELGPLKAGERRLRDAPVVADAVRVLLSIETPADELVKVRTYQEHTSRWR